jgi:ABC-type transport system involved in multi-copper enzyme maturation permease subunit
MNIIEIILFELRYRIKRPATYIYFAILFLMCFLAVTTDSVRIGGGVGQVKENAPITIASMMLIISVFSCLITSAVMGVAILRDFEHQTESMLFTTPIKKRDYLMGRFLGSFIVLIFILSGMMFGFMLGDLMPWRDAEKMLPYNINSYLHPFFLLVVPCSFSTAALFFGSGAISRKMLVIYTQGMLLLVLYITALNFANDTDYKELVAIVDPFAVTTLNIETEYWTIAEQNSNQIEWSGRLWTNRLLWFGLSIVFIVVTYFSFSFNVVRNSIFKKKTTSDESYDYTESQTKLPSVTQKTGIKTYIKQLRLQTVFYTRMVYGELPFQGILLAGLMLTILNSFFLGTSLYGTRAHPTTYSVIELLDGFNLFFLILIVFYSAELVWKERSIKFSTIHDSMPVPDFVGMVSKFLAMAMIFILLLTLLMITGMGIQMAYGYFDFDLSQYFTSLFVHRMSWLLLFTLLAFFIQAVVNNKFLGIALMVVFFITIDLFDTWGLEHRMFEFGSTGMGSYSDMNSYGHYTTPFGWFNLYWFGLAIFFFGLAVFFSVRGAETAIKHRWRIGKLRFTKPLMIFSFSGIIVFMLSGGFIFYNTNVLNEYRNSEAVEKLQADYEKTLKATYEWAPQPKIKTVNLNLDIYPAKRSFHVDGFYSLVNKTKNDIKEIYVQLSSNSDITVNAVAFDREVTANEDNKRFNFIIYSLTEPLVPGDSTIMNFDADFITSGFKEGGSVTQVVFNGTFFNNGFFPSIGYDGSNELGSDDTRKDNDLPEKERQLRRSNPIGTSMSFFGPTSDGIDFEIIMSTDENQVAIAPGYLQKEWKEDNRSYYHYKMDVPMVNFYSMMSANYELQKDTWQSDSGQVVDLEIYYHKGHEYNLDRMMSSMKKSFDYYSTNFSPYQYRQMRIMEFPRYSTFAQSFANTVPYSEGIGFILDVDEEDVDMAFYVTAHEMAHQWWGHQLQPANTRGGAMLSETLSQYSALMVMKQEYPQELMQKFLKEELDRYLNGRSLEQKKEMPLELVESQGYIHYRKGSIIMYALQDFIGEDSVNSALKRLINDWNDRTDLYPTTKAFNQRIREVTPDSLQYLITDMFETITLFENKAEEITYSSIGDEYEVTLKLNSRKLRADSVGNETEIPINDWIDIGVFTMDSEGEDSLVYLKKHRLTNTESEIILKINSEPSKAGIDPINKLIDRHPDDNVKAAILEE